MNKNTKVLALKYRPQVFDDLIGQDVVANTILNSIKSNKTPNAYLFTGIRGVGKTTTARIVAKSLNCLKGVENICKEDMCENCEAITNSSHIDVLEMDAASKTGVDDVRDLIDFARYGPSSAKYKIFIIDEVHMLSKQAFNALLKTLEEPPEYLKFIFATTEIKKIPVTVISRCQRFDLSRVKSLELLNFVKEIVKKEGYKATDDALKLIIKISEGSVRDALSLLDRALVSQDQNVELNLKKAQNIFGYFDKSRLIELFKYIFKGEEKKVIEIYKSIYDQGIEPRVFLNDFLEILYYFKNISSIKIDGTNFSLNDDEFNNIKELASQLDNSTLMLFWQFTIKTLSEIEIVSNQNLAIEMFLFRLIYLDERSQSNSENLKKEIDIKNNENDEGVISKKIDVSSVDLKNKTIGQIKNIVQEKNTNSKNLENKVLSNLQIKNLNDLIKACNDYKEIKLKYELETNVNLVSFDQQRIEISFNENMDKDFVKELSSKLFEWTNKRWIITLSKNNGQPSIKQKNQILKDQILIDAKKSETYKKILKLFPDAELMKIEEIKNDE